MARTHAQSLATATAQEETLYLWALKLRGLTYAQMKQQVELPRAQGGLGRSMSEATISRRIGERMAQLDELIFADVRAWRAILLDRYEAVFRGYVAMAGPRPDGSEPSPAVVDAGLKGMLATSAKIAELMGTNAAQQIKVEVTTPTNDDLELARLLANAREADETARRASL